MFHWEYVAVIMSPANISGHRFFFTLRALIVIIFNTGGCHNEWLQKGLLSKAAKSVWKWYVCTWSGRRAKPVRNQFFTRHLSLRPQRKLFHALFQSFYGFCSNNHGMWEWWSSPTVSKKFSSFQKFSEVKLISLVLVFFLPEPLPRQRHCRQEDIAPQNHHRKS